MTTPPPLHGVTWDHPRAWDCLAAVSRTFERDTGVPVRWTKRSLQAFADEPIEALAERHDLVVLDHPHVGQIAGSRCLRALPPLPDGPEASMGGSLESYAWDGALWAYPIDAACQMAVCREGAEDALPASWDALLAAPERHRGLLTPLKPVDAFDAMLSMLASRGEDRLPLDRRRFCGEANGELALRVLRTLYRLGPAEAVGWNPIDVLERLAGGEGDLVASPCLFGYVNYVRRGFRPARLVYRDLPGFEGGFARHSILGGAGLGVSARCGRAALAEDFAARVASAAVQGGEYLANEGQPAHRASWTAGRDDPELGAFFGGAFDTMATAWTRPRDSWFLGFVDDVCEILPGFFLDGVPEDDFLGKIQSLYRHHRGDGTAPGRTEPSA